MLTKKVTPKTASKKAKWFRSLPFWRRAERTIAQQLRIKGVQCTLMSTENKPWDIETASGLHIECKAANLIQVKKRTKRQPTFVVSIARPHRKTHRLKEDGVDFYVVRLLGDWKTYLVVPAPIGRKQLFITHRQLLTKYRDNIEAWSLITTAEKARSSERNK